MTTPRRNLVRPPRPVDPNRQRLRQRRQAALDKERVALARWTARLKYAFHAFERGQRQVARLEQQIRKMENR